MRRGESLGVCGGQSVVHVGHRAWVHREQSVGTRWEGGNPEGICLPVFLTPVSNTNSVQVHN